MNWQLAGLRKRQEMIHTKGGSLGGWDRGGHGRRQSAFLLSKGFRSPRLNFSCLLPTYLLFLAKLLGLYFSNGFKLGSQKREWENTHNCPLYSTPRCSTTLVPLIFPFPTGSCLCSVRSIHAGNKAMQNCPGLWRAPDAGERTGLCKAGIVWWEEGKLLFNWFNWTPCLFL